MHRLMKGYRPEIDGLRALAVVAVLIFHAEVSLGGRTLSGGFLGVDVFFVISGYLITRLIYQQMDAGTFSFIGFYERRARRILPALLVVVSLSTALGAVLLSRATFRELLQSVVSVWLFCSNVYFWSQAGYFGSAEHSPLLHTWSLAIEEQFYLGFPLVLWLARRWLATKLGWVVAVLGIISFGLAQYASVYHPVAAFYFLPTRIWELLAGTGLALWEARVGSFSPSKSDAFLALLGVGLVSVTMREMDETSVHPGALTLIPVVGACLILRFASGHNHVGRLLAARPLAHLGLISYSLYLWHQPLFTLARRYHGASLSTGSTIGLLLLCVVLAELTWRWIEMPWRSRQPDKPKRTLILALVSSLFVASLSAGLASFLPANDEEALSELGLKAPTLEFSYRTEVQSYRGSDRSWIVLGDCHAAILTASLERRLAAEGGTLRTYARNGCPFIPGFNYRHARMRRYACDEENAKIVAELRRLPPHTIVVAYRASLYLHASPFDNGEGGREWGAGLSFSTVAKKGPSLARGMRLAIDELLELGHRVILVYPLPELGWDPVEVVLSQKGPITDATASVAHERFRARNSMAYQVFDSPSASPDLKRIYPERLFCDTSVSGRCVALQEGELLYADNNHLSKAGADLVVEYIFNQVRAQ